MSAIKLSRMSLCWAVTGAALLSGCVVVPAGGRHGGYGGYGGYSSYGGGTYSAPSPGVDDGPVVGVAPPPPQVEVIPAAPALGYVWIGGYWTWHLGRHLWVGGRWSPGRPGYYWSPHRWQPYGSGWRLYGGGWQRR